MTRITKYQRGCLPKDTLEQVITTFSGYPVGTRMLVKVEDQYLEGCIERVYIARDCRNLLTNYHNAIRLDDGRLVEINPVYAVLVGM